MRIALLAVLVAAALVPAANAQTITFFRTPSGNIHCASEGINLRCEIVSGLRGLRQTRPCTDGDWGQAVGMTTRSTSRTLCISDTVRDPSNRVLAYGKTWTRGAFTCTSRTTGLTCRNRAGHGWFLSRERARLF